MSDEIQGQGTQAPANDEPATLPGEGRDFLLDEAIPGTLAGIIGGTLMMLVYMGGSWIFGNGPWDGPKMISSLFFRHVLLSDLGTTSILLGLAIHYAVSCSLAVAFAMALPRYNSTMFATFPLAVLYSMAMYVVMVYFVASWAAPLFARDIIHPLWFVGQLAWGACLGLIEPMRSRRWVESRLVPAFIRREAHGHAAWD
jgi:hypothetical protein